MLASALLAAVLVPQGTDPSAPLLSTADRVLPALGVTVRDERWLERGTGRILRRTTDAATGQLVDGDALLVAEAAARDREHGKMWHVLRNRVKTEARLRVVFWLEEPPGRPDLRAVIDDHLARGDSPEDARRAALAVAAADTRRVTEPFDAAVRAAGHAVAYVDPFVPIVFVDLPAAAVAALAARPDVDQAYYSFPKWAPEEGVAAAPNEWASRSARTDFVHLAGVTGVGVKVLVNDVGSTATANPYLPGIVAGTNAGVQSHATAVAGIIASRHTQHTGAAPSVLLHDFAGADDTQAPIAWGWGMHAGISFGNCSWWNFNRGSIVFLDRYFDYIIRSFAVMMFKSCGNQGNNQPTTTPGNGFNTTASGNADDRDSHDWDDDVMEGFSSTANPQPSNHEKPEVTAHGTNITSATTGSPWIGSVGTGTSFASPVTCGTAALLGQSYPTLLVKPEVIKAAIMAGAWNNVHGAEPLSDWDGAGAIDAAASQSAVVSGQFLSTTLTAASFSGGAFQHVVSLDAGDETRIVALWFSRANSSFSTDTLEMDVDMTVEDPSGAVVASSASAANPFEIVQFVPAQTGTYRVVLHRQRFLGASEPLAIVWNTWQNAATDRVILRTQPMLGSTLQLDLSDRYHPGATFAAMLSATPYPATMRLTATRMLAMGFDGLSAATFTGLLPGFLGTLDATGTARASLAIPQLPALSGLTLQVAMFTVDSPIVDVEETSAVTSFTIQ